MNKKVCLIINIVLLVSYGSLTAQKVQTVEGKHSDLEGIYELKLPGTDPTESENSSDHSQSDFSHSHSHIPNTHTYFSCTGFHVPRYMFLWSFERVER